MKRHIVTIVLVLMLALTAVPALAGSSSSDACWGQASAVFAQLGEMGEHASGEPTPRQGLRNLARYLYGLEVIPDDSIAALGQFVATSLVDENGDPLTIEACQ